MKSIALILMGSTVALLLGCATTTEPEDRVDSVEAEASGNPDVDYHLLIAEIALQRRQYVEAVKHYRSAALLSTDPDLAERATSVAFEYGLEAEALDSGNRWLSLDPDNVSAHRYVGLLNLRNRRAEEATGHFARILEALSDEPTAFQALLGLLGNEDNRQGATEVMRVLVEGHPDEANAHYALSRLALRSGDEVLALDGAARAVELQPDWEQAGMALAQAEVANGKVEEGLGRARELIAEHPETDLKLNYAELLLSQERDEEAEAQLEQLLHEEPGMPQAVRALAFVDMRRGDTEAAKARFSDLKLGGPYRDEAYYYLGRIAQNDEQHLQAIRFYSRVTGSRYAVSAQGQVGQIRHQLGDGETGIRHLDDFAAAHPRYGTPMTVAKSQLLAQMGRTPDAMSLLNDNLETRPGEPTLMDARARLYAYMAQQHSAEAQLREALELYNEGLDNHPGDGGLLYQRGFLYERMGKTRRAIGDLQALVKQRPDDPIALNALGYTLTDRTNRHREARGLIERAIELDPDNPAIIDSLGWVMHKQGKHEQALTRLKEAYELQNDPEIAAHIITVLWALERYEDAQELLERSLQEHPDNPPLQQVKQHISR